MAKYLFRSRWIALLWALSICFTISRFFGDGGGQEKLEAAAQGIRAQRMAQTRHEAAVNYYAESGNEIAAHTDSETEAGEPY